MKRSSGGSTSFTFSRVSAYQHSDTGRQGGDHCSCQPGGCQQNQLWGVWGPHGGISCREGIAGGPLHRGTADESDGLHGVVRGAKICTTRSKAVRRSRRIWWSGQFGAQRPNQLWVVGFTYVATWVGFVYVAFCIWRRMAVEASRAVAGALMIWCAAATLDYAAQRFRPRSCALSMRCFRSTPSTLPADPTTLLVTSMFAEEPLVGAADRFLDNELGQNDVNKFQALATGPRHVAALDSVTGGDRAGTPDIADRRRWALVTSPRRAGHPIRLLGLPLLASGGVAVRVHFGRGAPHRPPGGQPR